MYMQAMTDERGDQMFASSLFQRVISRQLFLHHPEGFIHGYLREEISDIEADHPNLWLYPDLVDLSRKRLGILHHVRGVASQGDEIPGQLFNKLVGRRRNGRHNWPHGGAVLWAGHTFVG